ncbi:hypothetical protein V6R21_27990 [Limibacter armeniacum]|uniref:methyltransferase RsmF C-terminal domain-like protein n=1 Tax=Limibacter armeniacum TaxID=466084 RepID=UPI002FE527EF
MNHDIKLPKKFTERMKEQLGEAAFGEFEKAFDNPIPVSLRLNPAKPTNKFDNEQPVPWCDLGKYLPKRPLFAKDPLIFAGAYYVQEASSMFLWHALKQHAPLTQDLRALDLCAAPGGKSTLISTMLTEGSLLVTNELMPNRLPALTENIVRWGRANTFVSHNDSASFKPLKEFFDVIAVDAPCSGEGMFRKDYKAVDMWSTGLVHSCSNTQKEILDDIMGCVKPGGLLLYSTCTFAEAENEESMRHIAATGDFEPLKIEVPEAWGITELETESHEGTCYGYRFIFHKTKGEGLFLSAFRKKGEPARNTKIKVPKKKAQQTNMLSKKEAEQVGKWLKNPEEFDFAVKGTEHIFAIPKHATKDFKNLNTILKLTNPGVYMGKINAKSGKLIPTHDLAVNTIISDKVPSFELDYEQAISYLRKQDFPLDTGSVKDWTIVKYEGVALGFIKVLPNRINNYYPMDLRLRKEF